MTTTAPLRLTSPDLPAPSAPPTGVAVSPLTTDPPEGHLPLGERPRPGRRPPRPLWAGAPDADPGPLPGDAPCADDCSELARADRAPRVRLRGLDVARALALVGLVAVHVLPSSVGEPPRPTWVATFVSGNAAALFALLAGVSLTLLMGGRTPASGRRRRRMRVALAVRALLLLLLGLSLNLLDFPVFDILPYYGLMFLMALPLAHLRTGLLLLLTAAFGIAGPLIRYLSFVLGAHERAMDPTLTALLQDPLATATTLFATGTYPAVVWMTYVCLGMALGRARLHSRAVQARMVLLGAGAVLVAFVSSWVVLHALGGTAALVALTPGMTPEGLRQTLAFGTLGDTTAATPLWQALIAPHMETIASTLRAAGVASAALGVVLLLQGLLGRRLGSAVAAMGSMSLTLYVTHLLVLTLPGWEDRPLLSFGMQVLGFLLFAWLWRRRFRQGPLEAVVSRIGKAVAGRLVPVRLAG